MLRPRNSLPQSFRFEMLIVRLRANGYAVINVHPCKLIDLAAREKEHIWLSGVDIFTNEYFEEVSLSRKPGG